MRDYVKLWTTFHDDPTIQNLSPKAIVYYVNALSWCGAHDDTDGIFYAIGKPPALLRELVEAGKFVPLDDGGWRINGWEKRQPSVAELQELREKRREAGRRGGLASGQARAKQVLEANTKQNEAIEVKGSKGKGEVSNTLAPRKRDALFDSLAEITGRDPTAMTRREARACATALADIKHASPDVTPSDIEERAGNYLLHMPHASLTPSALANHWSLCVRPPASREDARIARIVKEAMA